MWQEESGGNHTGGAISAFSRQMICRWISNRLWHGESRVGLHPKNCKGMMAVNFTKKLQGSLNERLIPVI